jgi:predicted HicB family RNase H-like nuclease
MPTRGTTHRTVRVDDGLWDAAKAAAAERGESLSDVIREALKHYVEGNEKSPRPSQ